MIPGYQITPAPPKETKRAELSRLAGGRHVLSASQLSTFTLCQRKWAWRYIAGVQEPSGAAAVLGGEVHSVLEAWLASGVAPDRSTRPGTIALAGLKHLPPPGSGVVEHGFLLHTPRNTYIGYIDWQGFFDGLVTILDHKTTSNLAYAKTAEDLLSDIQALIYALFACIAWNTKEVQLKWVYYTTASTPRSPAPTKTKIHLPLVLDRFDAIETVGEEIGRHIAHQTHPLALPATVSACGAYGGCPHRTRCNLSEPERLKAIMSEATMEQKLGMVPVYQHGQQAPLPQWNQPVQPQQPAQPQPVQQLQEVMGGDGLMYRQNLDGSWSPVQPAPQAAPPPQTFASPFQAQQPVQPTQTVAPFGGPQGQGVVTQPNTTSAAPIQPTSTALPTFNPVPTSAPVGPAPGYQTTAPQGPAINAPEGPSASEPKRGRGRPAGAGTSKKLEKLTSDRIAFLAGVTAACMAGVRDSSQLQAAGEACLVAFTSKFGE